LPKEAKTFKVSLRTPAEKLAPQEWEESRGQEGHLGTTLKFAQTPQEVIVHAVEEAIRWLGWRVYATNQPKEELPLGLVIVETTCPTEYTYWEVWYG
jgi:hypothetical protein